MNLSQVETTNPTTPSSPDLKGKRNEAGNKYPEELRTRKKVLLCRIFCIYFNATLLHGLCYFT